MKFLDRKAGGHARKRREHGTIYRRLALALGGCLIVAGFLVSGPPDNAAETRSGSTETMVLTLPTPAPAGTATPLTTRPEVPFEPLARYHAEDDNAEPVATPPEVPELPWLNVTVAPGDNLSLIFSRLKLSRRDLHDIAQLDHKEGHLRRLRPGQLLRFLIEDEQLSAMVVEIDDLNSLRIERTASGFSLNRESIEPEIRVASASTDIQHSLFLDGQKAGLSDALIMHMTDIFGWDIDFALDIRRDDRFSVIYEEILKDGEVIKQGRILAAEFVNRGKTLRAVLYTDASGDSTYYSDEGHAMRKAFLRTPVNFSRISSRFNLRRKHPVLNTIRAHRGVDYAAPMGTPIRATADGTIAEIGHRGGYGKTITLKHGRSYSTLYAHMSRFARGIKRGGKVKQGKIIGYVGKSGLATGPHLHYEFRVGGVHRNPLTVDLPKAPSIDQKYLADFRQKAAPLLERLAELSTTPLAPDSNVVARADQIRSVR